ncbi:hypothetical protein NPIL_360031, partial [Nephila pilipes]
MVRGTQTHGIRAHSIIMWNLQPIILTNIVLTNAAATIDVAFG